MRLLRIADRYRLDALVVLLVGISIAEIWWGGEIRGPKPALTAFCFLWSLPLFARRRLPVLAPVAAIVGIIAQALIWGHSVPYSFGTFMLVFVATGLLGLHLDTRRARLGGAALVLVALLVVLARDGEGSWTDVLTNGPILGFAWLVGHNYRSNRDRTAELRERADRLERERESEARAAVAEERTRIAREMHDVVAHSLSVMVVQAEAAEAMLDVDPERARRPLAAVQDTGRDALGELRRMLGALRESSGDAADLAPQAGLSELDALAAHVRDAGLPVRVRVEGEPRPLPAALDLSAFRIVQEGLTNALKHAGPARAEVLVRYGERELELEVIDDGRGHDPASTGEGHGILGMRERVALYGGRLTAGPRPGPDGGFSLCARIPTGIESPR